MGYVFVIMWFNYLLIWNSSASIQFKIQSIVWLWMKGKPGFTKHKNKYASLKYDAV